MEFWDGDLSLKVRDESVPLSQMFVKKDTHRS